MEALFKKIRTYPISPHLKELLKGSLTDFTLKISGIGLGYLFIFLVTRFYGARGLGIYSLTLSVILILENLGMLGFNSSVLRFIGELVGRDKAGGIKPLYDGICRIVFPFSICLACLLFLFARVIAESFFGDGSLTFAFRLFSLVLPLSVIYEINAQIIRAFKDILSAAFLINLNKPFLNLLFLLVIGLFTNTVYTPVLVFCATTAIGFVLSGFLVQKKMRLFRDKDEKAVSDSNLLKTSLPMLTVALAYVLMGRIDTIMLGYFSSLDAVGIYAVALKIGGILTFILYSVNMIAAPKISELYWAGKIDELKKVLFYASRIIFWASFPIFLGLVLFSDFLTNLFGYEFSQGKEALVILAIGYFVNAASGPIGYFLNLTGEQKVFRNIVLVASCLNLALNALLIPKWGMTGAALATMVSMVSWNMLALCYSRFKFGFTTLYLPIINRWRRS